MQGSSPHNEEIDSVSHQTAELIHQLLAKQVRAWKQDERLVSAQAYLLSRSHSIDVEVTKIGPQPILAAEDLNILLSAAATEQRAGFDWDVGDSAYAYPLRQEKMLQGVWLLYPSPSGEPSSLESWENDAQRFSTELFSLRQASLGCPPTFRQLVEAISDYEEDEPSPKAQLHWERSQARVTVAVEDELSASLMVDFLPIF